MELIQIGATPTKALTIREMFEQMAQREAEMIRAARHAEAVRSIYHGSGHKKTSQRKRVS